MMKKTLYILIAILIFQFIPFNTSFSYYFKIHELSANDGVFKDFRDNILFHNTQLLWRRSYFQTRQIQKNPFLKLKIAVYTVKAYDSLNNIARRTYLDKDTLISLNSLSSPHDIYHGKKMFIPNMRGTILKLKESTSLYAIASKYHIPVAILASVNKLNRNVVYQGERIFIPYRKLSPEEKRYFSSKIFSQPVAGRLSSRYGMRVDPFVKKRTFHGGIDIAAKMKTPVYAAQSGKVIFNKYMGGYGKLIIISHKYGYKTFYGHLSRSLVKEGRYVKKGQIIGRVGQTGRCTGPHLHYEIRRFNLKKNPLKFTHFFN